MTGQCEECSAPFGMFASKKACPSGEGGCGKTLCKKCLNFACMTADEAQAKGLKGKVSTFCKSCYKRHCGLDLTKTEDILGPEAGDAPAIVYLHGAAGCRVMFSEHAAAMVKKGYRCVLMDLPAHGGRMDEDLTLTTAIACVADTIQRLAPSSKGKKPLLIGGSLEGYVAMEFLAVHGDLVGGAVIMMCGQNVGRGRGCAAGAGLWAMKTFVPSVGAAGMLTSLVDAAKKNGHVQEEIIVRDFSRAGMFFAGFPACVEVMKATDPASALPSFDGPVLFMNGTKDHRDSENRWRDACKDGELIDYQDGDHFFSHDDRFAEKTVDDVFKWITSKDLAPSNV